MSRILNIHYTDGGDNYTGCVKQALSELDYEVHEVTDPKNNHVDLVVCSTFGSNILPDWFRGYKTLWISGENDYPDFNRYDFCVSTHDIIFNRHCRIPFFVFRGQYFALRDHLIDENYDESLFDRKFCSAVISNQTSADPRRPGIFNAINNWKHVVSAGKAFNNAGKLDDIASCGPRPPYDLTNYVKHCFISDYKFNLAFENSVVPGYITEKIVDAFAAKTIPIYFGAYDVIQEFNPDSFINALNYTDINDLIEEIKRIDSDKYLYMSMLRATKLRNEEKFKEYWTSFKVFLQHVIASPKQTCDYGWLKIKNKLK